MVFSKIKGNFSPFSYVNYIHRKNARGLGTAVVDGFRQAKGQQLIVMDADLQHPPELLPDVIEKLKTHDLVIPSRFIKGGSDGGLSSFRKLVSWTARKIGQISIKRFRSISDCTGGFFGLNRPVISNTTLNPNSWKILMEIIVKGNYNKITEIPYHFVSRDEGNSKMTIREQLRYLFHIGKLVWISHEDRRFYLFCFVGFLGVFVNLIFFHLFIYLNFHPLFASILASVIAMIHGFLWHDNVTWKGHKNPILIKRLCQFPKYVLVSLVGIVITAGMVKYAMTMKWSVSLGQLSGIAIATFWNYFANKKWTWKTKTS